MVKNRRLLVLPVLIIAVTPLLGACGTFSVVTGSTSAGAPEPTVQVNVVADSPTTTPQPAPEAAYTGPGADLIAAINARDLETLAKLIADTVALGYWRSEWQTYSREEIVSMIDSYMLQPGGQLTATDDPAEFPALDGIPVESIWGPDVEIAAFVFTRGWWMEGRGEAILALVEDGSGAFRLYGMLYAPDGFEGQPPAEPVMVPYPTPGADVVAWESLYDESVLADVTLAPLTVGMEVSGTGEQRAMSFVRPESWQAMVEWSTPSYFILQNDPDPVLDHGIPQEPLAKFDLTLLSEAPLIDGNSLSAGLISLDDFITVRVDGRPGLLRIATSEAADGPLVDRSIALLCEDEGVWVSAAAWIVIPDGDPSTLEQYTAAALHMMSTLARSAGS